jgi:hypothetical protein
VERDKKYTEGKSLIETEKEQRKEKKRHRKREKMD